MTAIDSSVRRLWTVAIGLVVVAGTQAFVHLPCLVPAAEARSRCASACARPSSARPARWGHRRSATPVRTPGACNRAPRSTPFLAQQSVDGGVLLPPVDRAEEYADFLAEAIRVHLDKEWMEQDCHIAIGNEVARMFREALAQGTTDLSTLVLDVGTGLEAFDMGDAFVGPWDIANLLSDFLMQRMGAETSGCSAKAPTTSANNAFDDQDQQTLAPPSPAVTTAIAEGMFRLTSEGVQSMHEELTSDFSRYRFLKDFMNEEGDPWPVVNTAVALYQGYTPEDTKLTGDEKPVRDTWRRVFTGPSPPDLRTAEFVVEALEADFPDDPDLIDGLEVIVETLYGGEAKKLDSGDPENGVPANEKFVRRATICKWLYVMGFLQDDIRRAPDDPEVIADLISGRKRLRSS